MKITLAFSVCIALLHLTRAQDNPGFINIDCGASTISHDDNLGLTYAADTGFVDSGETSFVNRKYFNELQNRPYLTTLRTFPVGIRNCYTLKPSQGKNNTYLIRASFMYGNYDNKFQAPTFDLHIDVNYWTTVKDISNYTYEEIIYTPARDFIQVCLINLGSGNPVISALELRLLDDTLYDTAPGAFLLNARENVGSTQAVRYPQDVYDRIWESRVFNTTIVTNTTNTDGLKANNDQYKVPIEVLTTAQQMRNTSRPMTIFWEPSNSTDKWFVYLHFAEIQVLQPGQLRQFSIYVNADTLVTTVTPKYLKPVTVISPPFSGDLVNVSMKATSNSTLPPYLNAIEYFRFVDLPISPTGLVDVNAIIDIKNTYEVVKESWQGDPCFPRDFVWTGLGCSEDRIISLNLSSSGLKGGIVDTLANLTALVTLDLSSNGLTGVVPAFLAELPNLKLLNLSNNNLNGSVPDGLKTKVAAGELQLSLDGNPNICMSCVSSPDLNRAPPPSSGENKKTIHSTLVAALASAVVLLTILSV